MSEDEILQALRDAVCVVPSNGVTALTVPELSDAIGLNERSLRCKLRVAMRNGSIEVVRVPRPCIDGAIRHVPAYRVKP